MLPKAKQIKKQRMGKKYQNKISSAFLRQVKICHPITATEQPKEKNCQASMCCVLGSCGLGFFDLQQLIAKTVH